MYRIELIDEQENLITSHDYNDKITMMTAYNKIKNGVNIRYKLHGLTMQLFEGTDPENLHELTKYRGNF